MTKTLIAKPVVKNQFWIVTENGEKVGNVIADGSGFEVKLNGTSIIPVTLLEKSIFKHQTNIDGTFTHQQSGSSVQIPKDSLLDWYGNAYSGNFTLEVAFLDMKNKKSWMGMPDGFIGFQANKSVEFETFNAIHIDLRSESGSALHIKSGSYMNISIKVGSTDLGSATYFWEYQNGKWISVSQINSN
jgi:hypothetical protein